MRVGGEIATREGPRRIRAAAFKLSPMAGEDLGQLGTIKDGAGKSTVRQKRQRRLQEASRLLPDVRPQQSQDTVCL
jgi:hypothetical protein